jgi:VWFA-related protein
MQPYDLAVIFQTSGGTLLQFSSDRKVLLSRVKSLRWKGGTGGMLGCGPSGCGVAPASRRDTGNAVDAETADIDIDLQQAVARFGNLGGAVGGGANGSATNARQDALQAAQDIYRLALFESQMAAIRYCIRTMQGMPGRKSILFISSVITIPEAKPTLMAQALDLNFDFYRDVKKKFDELADEALRAGVVIQTLDMKGLSETQPNPPSEGYIPLSRKTGGIIVENSNFFLNGIGPAEEELKGYYLISFIPSPNAFSDVRSNVYHRIQVKVKRHGTEVHTRDGYLGAPPHSNPNPESAASTNTLEQAIVSPFRYNDLKLDLASGYAFAPTPGYFLRSWLQLEGKDLNFSNEPDGTHSLSLELVTLTSNADGLVQDSKGLQYKFKVNDEDLSRIRKEGVDFNIYLPVKNSGDYYVRTAIRDQASGKIGSAYQFLQIPDLKKPRLALSSLFVINQNEEASDIKSGNIEGSSNASDSGRKLHETKSPALRSYLPGEGFDYLTMVYNAKNKEELQPNLESQVTIFKDGEKYFEGKREDVDLHGVGDLGRIPIMKRLVFDSKMGEGAYLLQLAVRDKQNKDQSRTASQAIDFEIRKEQ